MGRVSASPVGTSEGGSAGEEDLRNVDRVGSPSQSLQETPQSFLELACLKVTGELSSGSV